MSIEAIGAIWNHSTRRGTELLVLLAIGDYVNAQKGVAWPGVPKLAKKARLSERQLQRTIRSLERSGELKVFRNAGPKGTNLYKICFAADDSQAGESVVTGVGSGNDAVSSASSKGDTATTQSLNEPILERTPVVPTGDMDFWIKVSFDCFKQPVHPVGAHILRALSVAIGALNKNQADSLVEFYQTEFIDSKEPPYSSRRHSPERLILDLPRQLALAVQTCPPPKKRGYTIEDVWQYLEKEYPGCNVPNSLEELDGPLWKHIQREVYDAMRERTPNRTDTGGG